MLTPSEFIDAYSAIGERKVNAAALNLFLSGIMAGFFIGMGGVVTNVASNFITNPSVAKVVNGLLFPFGLIMVMMTGAELFTGNCLITISLLEGRVSFARMLRNLLIVYVGNFVGAVILAWAYVYSSPMIDSTTRTAIAKCSLSFDRALILGILCNILVCTAVMMGLCAKSVTGRAMGAYFPIAFFVIAGFEHCVANMYYVPAGLFAKIYGLDISGLTWGKFLMNNLLPVTLGNIIGGCILSLLLWQIHTNKGRKI